MTPMAAARARPSMVRGDVGGARPRHPGARAQGGRRPGVEYEGVFSRATVQRFVDESLASLGGARFPDFLPVLAYRFARDRLRAFGQAEGTIAKEVPEVLFVCVENAGRSQLAAAPARPPCRRPRARPLGGLETGRTDQPGGGGGARRARHLARGGVPEAAHGRSRPGCRRGRDDGLRRRLPDLPGQALRGLEGRRPVRQGAPRGARHPRRDRRACARSARRAGATGCQVFLRSGARRP